MSQANPARKSLLYLTSIPQYADWMFLSQKNKKQHKTKLPFLENISFSRNLLKLRRMLQTPNIESPAACPIQPPSSSLFGSSRCKHCAHASIRCFMQPMEAKKTFCFPHMLWGFRPQHPAVRRTSLLHLWLSVGACRVLSCRTNSTHISWEAAVLFLTHFKQEDEAPKFSVSLTGISRIPVVHLRLGRKGL